MTQSVLWSPFKFQRNKELDLQTILKEIPVFKDLNRLERGLLCRILHKREYSENELIFNEAEAGNGMYIIFQGQVDIFGTNEKDNEVHLATLSNKQFFGELSLIDGAPRSATAVASKKSTLFGFFKPDLLELIEKNPTMGSKILLCLSSVLSERLRQMNTQNTALQQKLKENAASPTPS